MNERLQRAIRIAAPLGMVRLPRWLVKMADDQARVEAHALEAGLDLGDVRERAKRSPLHYADFVEGEVYRARMRRQAR